jgi:hypothetical protein
MEPSAVMDLVDETGKAFETSVNVSNSIGYPDGDNEPQDHQQQLSNEPMFHCRPILSAAPAQIKARVRDATAAPVAPRPKRLLRKVRCF